MFNLIPQCSTFILYSTFLSPQFFFQSHCTTTAVHYICPKSASVEPDKPIFDTSELLEDLLGLTSIAEMLGVSRWAISRRIKAHGLDDLTTLSKPMIN